MIPLDWVPAKIKTQVYQNNELQRLMVRDVKSYQDHQEICTLSPADVT